MLIFFFFSFIYVHLFKVLSIIFTLLFFLVIIEDNVSFRLGGGTWDDLHLVLFYVNFFLKFFFSDFCFFSPIFKKKKRRKKKKCCFSKSFKSKVFMLLLSKEFHFFYTQLLCIRTLATWTCFLVERRRWLWKSWKWNVETITQVSS